MKNSVIITAGGIGKRMGAKIPKQFIEINRLPILMHTINQFNNFDPSMQIVISLPCDFIQMWRDLVAKHKFKVNHEIVEGGVERYHSIKNALKVATGEIVLVHDAVRPFVNEQTINNVVEEAIKSAAAIPVLPIKESIRKGTVDKSEHKDRSKYWTVQTPQAFQRELLNEAYKTPFSKQITDDASLIELLGKPVVLTQGNEENIKITTPYDLKIAEFLISDNT